MPATPTILIADNADGTGATVTISGSDAGSSNTLYVTKWSGGLAGASFTSAGSRTGDGTIAVTGLGYYWAYVASSLSGIAVSAMHGYRATSGTDPVFDRCLDAVEATLKALSFDGLTQADINVRKFPWNFEQATEGIYVSPVPERTGSVFNNRYDVLYGIQITAFAASNHSLTSELTRAIEWREQIRLAFANQSLAGMGANGYLVTVEPGPVFDQGPWRDKFDVGSLLLRISSREYHGVA